jgi:peptidoglycan/xylan/chitin deacetylase (PgdA/CDA1 family)
MERDLIGYGGEPPQAQWPEGARLALNLVVNVEEGSEPGPLDGDAEAETALTEITGFRVPTGDRDLAAESVFEYGARAGFWRVHRLFTERSLPYTAFACALALERNPAIAKALAEGPADLCGHGYRWENHFLLDRETETRRIIEGRALLTQLTGKPVPGWYCRYGPSINTRSIVAAQPGIRYLSDSYADDLPYWMAIDGAKHLIVPYALDTNDAQFKGSAGFGTGADFFTYLLDAVTLLRDEGRHTPKMLSVGLHPRLVGRPGRAAGLARFLDAVLAMDDVWVCNRIDIAEHWHAMHPAT